MFTSGKAYAKDLTIKEHIPRGCIHNFELYEDSIFISPYDGGIDYFDIDDNFNLIHQYTFDPGEDHILTVK